MGETCPFGHNGTPHARIRDMIEQRWRGNVPELNIGMPPQTKIIRYANYAYLIDALFNERSVQLLAYLENLYTPEMSIEIYLDKVKWAFHSLIERVIFPDTLDHNWTEVNNGIGTMFTVLQAVFQSNPRIKKEDCLKLCKGFMREVPLDEFPVSGSGNTRTRYQGFVAGLMEHGNLKQKNPEDPYCPALYTKGGNALLGAIVEAVYKHFPELGT